MRHGDHCHWCVIIDQNGHTVHNRETARTRSAKQFRRLMRQLPATEGAGENRSQLRCHAPTWRNCTQSTSAWPARTSLMITRLSLGKINFAFRKYFSAASMVAFGSSGEIDPDRKRAPTDGELAINFFARGDGENRRVLGPQI